MSSAANLTVSMVICGVFTVCMAVYVKGYACGLRQSKAYHDTSQNEGKEGESRVLGMS